MVNKFPMQTLYMQHLRNVARELETITNKWNVIRELYLTVVTELTEARGHVDA